MVETTGQFRALKYYTLSGFFVIGVVTVLLGQVLPILSMRLGLDDAQAGTLFVAQFLGSAIGTLCASRIWRRYGFVVTTVVGLGMMIIGLPGLNFQNFALCWIAIFVYGSGLGMTIPAINLLTIEMTPESSRTSAVNLINFAWGVGAICSQPFVAVVSPPDSIVSVTIILDATLLLLLFCYLLLMKRIPASKDDSSVRTRLSIWRRPSSWLFLAFGFFVIGIESGMGGWLTTYSRSLTGRDQAINATVLFFAFMVLGRGLASIVSRYLSDSVLISVCACTLLT
ncbi:MAG: MFS transporter, partial [Pyrinomonadaceae bacterium]